MYKPFNLTEYMNSKKAFSAIVIKTVSEERREITGTASTPQLDRVNDIVEPLGLSFAKDAPLLLNHDHSQPVGTVQFGTPTAKGLPFRAQIAKVTEPGVVKDRTDEAWHSVKAGLIKGVSIGFMPKESEAIGRGSKAGTRYKKAEIHELSLVAIPCNPEAVITAFKSLEIVEGVGIRESSKSGKPLLKPFVYPKALSASATYSTAEQLEIRCKLLLTL